MTENLKLKSIDFTNFLAVSKKSALELLKLC